MRKSITLSAISITLGAMVLSGCAAVDKVAGSEGGATGTATSAETGGADGADDARTQLAELKVGPDGSMDGYSRDRFPHWSNQGEGCNTRETVLKRDGDGVKVDDKCRPTSGSWTSPYDGETWTDPADVDIDHVVPLAEAWRSGADAWTDEERERFANDLDGVNLLAVTDNVNQSKGDKGPEDWQPPLESYWCTYAILWIDVKHTWELTVEEDEKATLEDMLDRC
ncbi:protein of unknown function (DUF1994) [Saccharomonospora azurea NA-128]|uniref:GmrSD restriction endonucleases C-terminal domain-containing protein n=2 Tax=Saccharomonospora azurea TaxID=40988 RepID=H8G9I2_9PSEU|nr:protein of unknown function (DUF1994) [Saccharomonospora azurea NA-128]